MSTTISYTETLETTRCHCGIAFAVPTNLLRYAHDDAKTIYCPLGHPLCWRETAAMRLQKELVVKQQRLEEAYRQRQAERELREHTERQLSAQKGATTKAKKRHAAALCLCCNRSFVQLRRHIAAKHPGYDPAAPNAT